VRLQRGRAGAESASQQAAENASRHWDDAGCEMECVPDPFLTLRGRMTTLGEINLEVARRFP